MIAMRRMANLIAAASCAVSIAVLGLTSHAGNPATRAADSGPETATEERPVKKGAASAPYPQLSIYQLDSSWDDTRGGVFQLSSLSGHPVLVMLFYGTCEYVCPTLIRNLKDIEAGLDPTARKDMRYLLVSFDPAVDTPERLRGYAIKNELDASRWFLPHGEPEQIRELAVVLGVRYRPTAGGHFSHSSRITLLDREGVIVEHIDGLSDSADPILAALRNLRDE